MCHASYLKADQDIDFLNLNETRGVLLQTDYQKAALLLREHGIEHPVFIFGSTRIKEPAAAQRHSLDQLSELSTGRRLRPTEPRQSFEQNTHLRAYGISRLQLL